MRYMYDTEFHEDGRTIDFISIGIVAEDGREYYAVSLDFDTERVVYNDWLMQNVMSSIRHETGLAVNALGYPLKRWMYVTDQYAKPKIWIAREIQEFVGADREPEFWAWYSAYDHVCLAQLFGKMIDLPDNIPMHTDDLKTLVRLAEKKVGHRVELPKQPAGHHDALVDARWNKVRYDYLMEILNG